MPDKHDHPAGPNHLVAQFRHEYYSELNRVISTLFVGVLALMTFLLTVGVQRPHQTFSWALYASIIVLALNLVAFVAGHMFHSRYLATMVLSPPDAEPKDQDEDEDKDGKKAFDAKRETAHKRLKVARITQQALFIIAVACVAWLAISAAQFFFAIPSAPTGGAPQ